MPTMPDFDPAAVEEPESPVDPVSPPADPSVGAPAGPAAPTRGDETEDAKGGRRVIASGASASDRAREVPSPGAAFEPFAVQLAKVHEPPMRPGTLARGRLLEWLGAKVHQRVVLLVAEAGYGKTTLLGDFARRTRRRSLWYRLDESDYGWVPFLTYLVAAGREFVPGFAPTTSAMLRELGPNGPAREAVVETFMRELAVLDEPASLILDDFHHVDDSDDVRFIMRGLLERLPPRVSVVIASRRQPTIPLARLRGQGEVAELPADELRFDEGEVETLFRESYGLELEAEVVGEVVRRTEGWAASLELVHAALRERPDGDLRSFVADLSGSKGEIYDYLTEEVVGELPVDLQRFLMRTSILETLHPELAMVAAGIPREEAEMRIEEAQRYGLLSRRSTRIRAALRFHPLVGEFLEARLIAEIGWDAVADLHRSVARAVEDRDWGTACRHYGAAGDGDDVARVIEKSIARIMATGDYALAESFIERFPAEPPPASFDVVLSRMSLRRGHEDAALESARRALATSPKHEHVIFNLASVRLGAGSPAGAAATATSLLRHAVDPDIRRLASATVDLVAASLDGDLAALAQDLKAMGRAYGRRDAHHYAAVSRLNAANAYRAVGDSRSAAREAKAAAKSHEATGARAELVSAKLILAWAAAHEGRLAEARSQYLAATELAVGLSRFECANESADIEIWYGDAARGRGLLAAAPPTRRRLPDADEYLRLSALQLALREGDTETLNDVSQLRFGRPSAVLAEEARRLAIAAHARIVLGRRDANSLVAQALAHAEGQSAGFWSEYCKLLLLSLSDSATWSGGLALLLDSKPVFASVLAEVVVRRLGELDSATLRLVHAEAQFRPERWRSALRATLALQPTEESARAAELLEVVGTKGDVPLLRQYSRSLKPRVRSDLGIALARRLADRIYVEDLGRIIVRIGDRITEGTMIRRKVLALLCFLLTRPRRSATRDEVLDALWPDLEPDAALNSLNQTLYFLRRVFEAQFKEELSPGYVHHESDVIWLDNELIRSRSVDCGELIQRCVRSLDDDLVDALSEKYRARFALDFAYEPWSAAYRDSMHASYLGIIEGAVSRCIATGNHRRALVLARRVVDLDPEAEELEVSLLRVYRGLGAAAAAAEQYAHYASVVRDTLGIEPPALDDL